MGLNKLNSEYDLRYKTFPVHRPVTIKAKTSSYLTGNAPEALESSRRAGLLSNQFLNVSEPALQRKRIVPYKYNHNILSTSTVKALNDKDWLEIVGNEDEQFSGVKTRTANAKKTEDTEYSSRSEKQSPITIVSEERTKQKAQEHAISHQIQQSEARKNAAREKPSIDRRKSPEKLPAAGLQTYIVDQYDKRLLRPCNDLLHPAASFSPQITKSQTEYSERYNSPGQSKKTKEKNTKKMVETSIDIATYKKVLQQRNDAYGLASRTNRSPKQRQRMSEKREELRGGRSHLAKRDSESPFSESRENELTRARLLVSQTVNHKDANKANKTTKYTNVVQRRTLDEDSSSYSTNSIGDTKQSKSRLLKMPFEYNLHGHKSNATDVESISSRDAENGKHKTTYKEKQYPVHTRPENVSQTSRYRLKCESTPPYSPGFQNPRKTEVKNKHKEQNSRENSRKSRKKAWEEKPMFKQENSTKVRNDNARHYEDRGRSPTPEMRLAGHSRRHHLDVTTGSNNPLASGLDPRTTNFRTNVKYGHSAF